MKFPVVRIDRDRRVGVEAITFGPAGERHPGLGLSGSPEGQVERRIVAAGDPHFAAGAILVRQVAPGVSAWIAGRRDGVEPPELFAGLGIVSAHEAFFFLIALAAAEAFEDLAVDHERTAGVAIALGDLRVPDFLAVAGVESR